MSNPVYGQLKILKTLLISHKFSKRKHWRRKKKAHALIASPENHKKDWLKLTYPSQGTLDCEHIKEKERLQEEVMIIQTTEIRRSHSALL